jgi:hypothetical protein
MLTFNLLNLDKDEDLKGFMTLLSQAIAYRNNGQHNRVKADILPLLITHKRLRVVGAYRDGALVGIQTWEIGEDWMRPDQIIRNSRLQYIHDDNAVSEQIALLQWGIATIKSEVAGAMLNIVPDPNDQLYTIASRCGLAQNVHVYTA